MSDHQTTATTVGNNGKVLGHLRTVEIERFDGSVDEYQTDKAPWAWREFLCIGQPGQRDDCDYIPMKAFKSFRVIEPDAVIQR